MTNPDWTKAPEGATHWDPTSGFTHEVWIREVDDVWYSYRGNNVWRECADWMRDHSPSDFMRRPIKTSGHRSESIVIKSETIITIQTDYEHVDKVYVNGKLYAPVTDGEC